MSQKYILLHPPNKFSSLTSVRFTKTISRLGMATYRPFSEVTSRHVILRTGGQASKQSYMCKDTDLKVILKFSRNGELLCGAWLLKSFQQREGQRLLSYSPNLVEIEAQKASF